MSQPLLNNAKPRRGIEDWVKIIRLGENIPNQSSINSHCDRIISTTEEILGGYACLWLSNSAFSSPHAGLSPNFDIQYQTACSPLMQKAAKSNKIVSRVEPMSSGFLYSIAAPVNSAGSILGVILIERQGTKFTQAEKRTIEGLTMQAGIALDVARRRIVDQWSVDLLELVRNVAQEITEVMDGDELVRRVTRLIQEKFKYYYVAVFTYTPDSSTLQYRNSASQTKHNILPIDPSPFLNIKFGEGIIGRVALTGIELLENNVASSQYYRHIDALPETKAEFALPLRMGNQVIGVLDVQSDVEDSFHEMDILVLRALADHIALAINNSKLYSDITYRANQLSIVADISKAISSILDFDHLLNNIVTLIHRRFSVPGVSLYLTNWGRNQIVFRAGAGSLLNSAELEPNIYSYDIGAQVGLVPWAVQNQQSVLVKDASSDERFEITPGSQGARSELVIPLSFGDKVLGAIDLQSPQVGAFTSDDVIIFDALADFISVAIRNANLYSTEQWRRIVAESIQEVAGLLSADIALDKVLERILQELHKTLPCDVSAIWLLEDNESDSGIGQYTSPLRLAAIYSGNGGRIDELHQEIDALHVQELLQTSDLPGSLSPWMVEALESTAPLVRSDTSPYEPIGSYLNFSPEYSAIAAPLKTGELTLGLLVLTHRETGKYGSESQAITTTYASYSAVAIRNTRLYEAAHDQAWVATVLLQVAEATQSVTSMPELVETVVRIIPRLIGIKSCVLFSWDINTESFIPESYDSLEADQALEFPTWIVTPGEIPAFDQVLNNKAPVIIDRDNFPLEVVTQKFSSLNVERELLGLFPMVSQNTILGVILINFTPNEVSAITSNDLWEEKFTIIQGIANQTAVAVENLQLLQSQEEEAYISVALLQVAQAVVSLNDLDEILSTIVRIMPILVGVKRSVIYLCESVNNEFHLSQSYGISRQELAVLPPSYSYQEHYLLSTVRETGLGVIKQQPLKDEAPILWSTYTQNDLSFSPTVLNSNGDVSFGTELDTLRYKGRLLFGFPLVIKGEVLGIMIAEEADNQKGTPSLHIRERRLEIITGIIQQVALAIQNDRFKKEVLDRERMAREMQLAREIQTTFLPEFVPVIKGWDLDIRWKPARQVGGDFYDFIKLPDSTICLVMADVADKGMPAALFMTLVRTLIRAAAKDTSSPSSILMQVNDLLVPDSKKGMFVTILVAFISPDDGTIIYANAGHNPPIVQREPDRILIELLPTGMALGVIEGIEIGEQRITIAPGEKLIVYTDGVTEAFSVGNEIFGVERLKKAISGYKGHSAKKQLDKIEGAISKFIANAAPSDDLTLAAFIRKQ